MNSQFKPPKVYNETVKTYLPGSPERKRITKELARQMDLTVEIPLIINGRKIHNRDTGPVRCPHDHGHILGNYSKADDKQIRMAIDAALAAKPAWEAMAWQDRAAVFLRAADLISQKYTYLINGATMLNQSKNVFQAEIDATCELVDFLRFNVRFMEDIYGNQPLSEKGIWNKVEYRPLEGFVFALTPFNFTAIAGNLCTAPAMMGNTVVWKPSSNAVLSGYYLMEILYEAGLPDGVINFIPGSGSRTGKIVLDHKDLAGIHFTGSTRVFQTLWQKTAENIALYKSYPRIVGETGGKDYIFMHPSADMEAVVTAAIRGAFEYQGQKCSACSRLYLPQSQWDVFKGKLTAQLAEVKYGSVLSFTPFLNAVIDEKAFDNICGFINRAKGSDRADIIAGGVGDKSRGYFIEPTVILARDPFYESMVTEIFGPLLTIYVYDDKDLDQDLDRILAMVDKTSPYALTGAIFARDRQAIARMTSLLTYSAGNFYINDKPSGAVVGQQPFGGARKSGTNDKAGSMLNLLRWTSPRTIKENFVPPVDFKYPFMAE
jgi:1-pyrroline-5-carboxylate dehydrogenase